MGIAVTAVHLKVKLESADFDEGDNNQVGGVFYVHQSDQ